MAEEYEQDGGPDNDGDPEEEGQDEEGEDEEPEEKIKILHVQKGIKGCNSFALEFMPDKDFLEQAYGPGIFTIMEKNFDELKGHNRWKKTGIITVEPPADAVPAQNPIAVSPGRGGYRVPKDILGALGDQDLDKTIMQIRQLAAAKLQMAFADALGAKDYEAAKQLANVVSGNSSPQNDKYQALVEKMFEKMLTEKVNPTGTLKEQIAMFKDIKGLVEAPAEHSSKRNTWEMIAEMADKHLPSIMENANKQAELQKEVLELKRKEADARMQHNPIVQGQQPIANAPAQTPFVDRFIVQILNGAEPAQLRQLIAAKLPTEKLEGLVKPSFNVDLMAEKDYGDLCDLFEFENIDAGKILLRIGALAEHDPKLKEIHYILSTVDGKLLLQHILDIVESLVLPPETAQEAQTAPSAEGEKPKRGKKNAKPNLEK